MKSRASGMVCACRKKEAIMATASRIHSRKGGENNVKEGKFCSYAFESLYVLYYQSMNMLAFSSPRTVASKETRESSL